MPPTPVTASPVATLTGGVYRGAGSTDLYNATTGQKLSADETTNALRAAGYNLDKIETANAGSTPNRPYTPAPSTVSDTRAPVGSKLNANGHFVGQDGNTYSQVTPTPSATLTANVQTPTSKTYTAPASITSDTAKADMATKANTVSELHQNVSAQNEVAGQPQPQTQTDEDISSILSGLDKNLALSQANETKALAGVNSDLATTQAQADAAAHAGYSKLQAISSGTYPLSSAEKGMVEATKQSYQQVLQAQATANSGALGQVTELMATLGLSHSAPIQSMSLVQNVISRGTARLAEITTKMTNAVNTLEMKLQQHDFNNVQTAYKDVSKAFQDRITTLEKMQSSISKAATSARTDMINYARTAVDAIVSSNKATEQQKKDATTAAYEAGLLTEKHYANVTARINATATKGAKPLTTTEQTSQTLQKFSSIFSPGFIMPAGQFKGQTVLDKNGYIKPEMWKAAIRSAQQEGVSRKKFISNFGNFIYINNGGTIARAYGLTSQEKKSLTG